MARNLHRSVNYRQSSVNSDMFPMIRYCSLPGTVQYGTVLTYSHSQLMYVLRLNKNLFVKLNKREVGHNIQNLS